MSRAPGLRFDFVVFDLDGVLVDSAACHAWAFERLWAECGVAAPPYELLAGRTTVDVVRDLTAPLSPDETQIQKWVALKQALVLECFERDRLDYPDALSALQSLRQAGVRMAVGTGASSTRASTILERLGIADWFELIVAAEDVHAGKPDPETYRLAIERAGVAPGLTVVVEDSAAGVAAALAAGARVVTVRTGVRAEHPNFVSSCSDLHELLTELGVPSP